MGSDEVAPSDVDFDSTDIKGDDDYYAFFCPTGSSDRQRVLEVREWRVLTQPSASCHHLVDNGYMFLTLLNLPPSPPTAPRFSAGLFHH